MGLYADHIFPRVMDWVLRDPRFQKERQQALVPVRGRALEIGFGTGLNLPHYPSGVTWLTGIDSAALLEAKVAERSVGLSMPVEVLRRNAEALPFADRQFDCVISTWTLCSIRDVHAALREVRRVLKPGGRLVFLEHGRSDDPRVAKWQDRLNPIQRIIACGCNLNRRIDRLIVEAGLTIERQDRYVLPGIPRIAGDMYRGVAILAVA
jgi:ubiquinone/menaquinone biosynthesis C-methylase UbiE